MKIKITLILSLIFVVIILKIVTFSKNFVENYYSRLIYKNIAGTINRLSSNFNFSLGEILLFLFIIAVIIFIVIAFKKSFLNANIKSLADKSKTALNFLYILACSMIVIYIIFLLVWGLNYHRVPLIENYPNRMIESEYNKVFEDFEFLNMHYSKTKPIMISKLFLHLQITGIYSPFTSEANVNILIPSVSIPFTIGHEMAHQIGIAYEDEANFISYVACSKHTDPFVRYSANFEAFLYVLGALKRDENYAHLMANLNSDTKEDIKKYYEFWNQYTGNLSKVSQKVNDTYLKANSQDDGIKSYSRVVKLLVLYHNINPQ